MCNPTHTYIEPILPRAMHAWPRYRPLDLFDTTGIYHEILPKRKEKDKVATLSANKQHAIGRGQSCPSKALISSLALALQGTIK